MSKLAIERQVIVTWYTPEEKLPPEGETVVITVSGQHDHVRYDHAFALAEWFDDCYGWELSEIELDEFVVHAWCDLKPYDVPEINLHTEVDGGNHEPDQKA